MNQALLAAPALWTPPGARRASTTAPAAELPPGYRQISRGANRRERRRRGDTAARAFKIARALRAAQAGPRSGPRAR